MWCRLLLAALWILTGGAVAGIPTSDHYVLTSDSQSHAADGTVKAWGNVRLVNGHMQAEAQEAEYRPTGGGDAVVTAWGNPVRYRGKTEDGIPFTGQSDRLTYQVSTGVFIFRGHVVVNREGHTLTAPVVTYHQQTRQVLAGAEGGQRPHSTIMPTRGSH